MKLFSSLITQYLQIYRQNQLKIIVLSGLSALSTLLIVWVLSSKPQEIPKFVELPEAVQVPTPNQSKRPDFAKVGYIVIYVVEGQTLDHFFSVIRSHRTRYSLHYTITPAGDLYQHVSEDNRAMSIGAGKFPDNRREINELSISIGLFFSYSKDLYALEQLSTLRALLQQLTKKYKIKYIVTESQISREPSTDLKDTDFPFQLLPEFAEYFWDGTIIAEGPILPTS